MVMGDLLTIVVAITLASESKLAGGVADALKREAANAA
jgi:hypothetical protein